MGSIKRSAKEFRKFLPADYRKRDVYIRAADSVTLIDLNWSGGTRSIYSIRTIDGAWVNDTSRYSALAPWSNRAEGVKLPIPAGFVVVETGYFCGKPMTATICVHPSNMPQLLPAA